MRKERERKLKMSCESGFRIECEDVGSCLAALLLFIGEWMYNKCVCGLYKFVVWVGMCVAV